MLTHLPLSNLLSKIYLNYYLIIRTKRTNDIIIRLYVIHIIILLSTGLYIKINIVFCVIYFNYYFSEFIAVNTIPTEHDWLSLCQLMLYAAF